MGRHEDKNGIRGHTKSMAQTPSPYEKHQSRTGQDVAQAKAPKQAGVTCGCAAVQENVKTADKGRREPCDEARRKTGARSARTASGEREAAAAREEALQK